jgi:hemolysin III
VLPGILQAISLAQMTSPIRPNDEMANVISHGIGFLLSLAASRHLMTQVSGQSIAIIVACGIYSLTLVVMYGCSTLSHIFYDLKWRQRFRTLDQVSIFLLIAGTYTPFAVAHLDHGWWRLVLIAMWGLALLGTLRVLQVQDLSRNDKFTYGLLGYLPVVTLAELSRQAPTTVVLWIIAGGACYSVGAIFLRLSSSVPYAHAVWHTFVVAGSACHYQAILMAVTSR